MRSAQLLAVAAVVVTLAVIGSVQAAVTCKNANGETVDWWYGLADSLTAPCAVAAYYSTR